MMDFSFREKSTLGSLLALVLVAVWYFGNALGVAGGEVVEARVVAKIAIAALVVLIVIQGVYHALLAIASPPEQRDERDRLITAKAERNGGLVLGFGVFFTIGHIAIGGLLERVPNNPFIVANLLLLALVVSEAVKYVSQLIYYRRGV